MNQTQNITVPHSKTYDITMTALMAAVTCILAPLSIPIGPVPISFTNLAIYLSLYLLGWKKGTVSYLIDPLLTVPKSYHDAIEQIQLFAQSIKVRHEYTLVPLSEMKQEWWCDSLTDDVQVQWMVNTEKPEIVAVRQLYNGKELEAVLCITLDYNKIDQDNILKNRSDYH